MVQVVMGAPLGNARGQRQDGLDAIPRRDLALLVDAQHHGLERRARYNPPMSRTFSTNSRSLDSLQVSWRCGCRPKARRMRVTTACDRSISRAMVRMLQCVAPPGTDSSVRAISVDTRIVDAARSAQASCIQQTVQAQLNEACSQCQGLRGLSPQRQCCELFALRISEHQFAFWFSSHRHFVVFERYTTDSNDQY